MGKYINKKHTFKLASIGLLLASLVGCGSNSGDNQAITLDELYKKHNLSEMTKTDEEMNHFNAVANYTLNAYSDTPYAKYVAETIVEAANSQDPTAFEDIIYKLGDYYYNAGEFEAAQIEKTFLDYAPSFRKDNTDFKFKRAILIANKDEIIDHAHSRYIVKFDKKYGTNIKDLNYSIQLKLEEILKSNIGGEYEQEISEIVATAYNLILDEEKNPISDEFMDSLNRMW